MKKNRWRAKHRHISIAEWQQRKIDEAHARRAADPVKQAKIDAQARQLLFERVGQFGTDWHVGCAIRLPADIAEAVARDGPDVLLLMLDR